MARAQSASEWPSLLSVIRGRKLMVATTGSPPGAHSERDLHFLKVEKCLQDQKVDPGILQQPDLFREQVAGVPARRSPFPLEELRPRHDPATRAGRPRLRCAILTAASLIRSVSAP